MTDPELPDRMGQLEKTVNASTTPKNKYADYSDTRKAAINVRTGQDWAKKPKDDPDWDIFEKNKPTKSILKKHSARIFEDCLNELPI
ncbi:hypothetical protein RO3G_01449 [Rhizopus delemar RA 99-880]|uniref:Uncharacterized protein n=1 Tax=Rhizopus delemar (strain RA 99-880 / ATCC MYA-4621 / FGSC 9543 / NRRL 43880) TaxID=246409 RepID=I1BKL5_RHIO9|nr:hypothetical protein RO3G_01449 [Rhizopus delemar RA 99-880]|eukprot:EIE76745.1 hypothetical protein RO3G_01449 [Rhizopus delemar RA 99-880]